VEFLQSQKWLCRPPSQPAIKQRSLALARHKIDVAYQFCAILATLQHDLTTVKRFQLGTMGDALLP